MPKPSPLGSSKPPRRKPYMLIYDDAGYAQSCGMGQSIDDFAVTDVQCVHLERMDDNNYWMGLNLKDGTHFRFWIGHLNPKARVSAFLEIEKP